jgi:ATP-dependent exoDNAse (exonuclease V) beta subunit
VVLTRATTDLRAYERALEQRGVPTYMIGGRGYWSHPQVLDVVAYLRVLANPRDEEALYTVLLSPIVGVSLDAVVVLAAAAREAELDPFSAVGTGAVDSVGGDDRDALVSFREWFGAERAGVPRLGAAQLIDRMLELTGFDLSMLAMPGGRRRLANVRKLMRLAHEHEQLSGRDLSGFLDLVRGREQGWAGYGDAKESEAPVEGEALDAVRLMTIHRAKGLEFPIVCVADLGRQPWRRSELLRLGRDDRIGMRLAEPGTGKRVAALDYEALGEAQFAAEAREERRLFYVAMTRARERLILSGAAKLEAGWEAERAPIGWIAPALEAAGVQPTVVEDVDYRAPGTVPAAEIAVRGVRPREPRPPSGPPVSRLSYSSLEEYRRCAYRFYMERVLGVPPVEQAVRGAAEGMAADERGVLIHALLEPLDYRRAAVPDAEAIRAACVRAGLPPARASEVEEIQALLGRFADSGFCARLGRAGEVRREERFTFKLPGEVLMTGVFDVLAREPGGRILVADYKSDRLEGADPEEIVRSSYAVQRLVYGLAAIRAGARHVEVAHVFLEDPARPATEVFTRDDRAALEAQLSGLAAGVFARRFEVALEPHRGICHGCPAEGGLCSWPLEMTRRESADRLF